jgi:tetratricopeptide (TPR) repeat protein
MAINKLQVFLASRFEEFHSLRGSLKAKINGLQMPPVEAIDLNDNVADPYPPLGRCYKKVDQAELFVLLVGDTYGTNAKGHNESYTHLEYKYALNESKIILPFLIGNLHQKTFVPEKFTDHKLRDWVAEIFEHHTPSYLDATLTADELATDIFGQVLNRLIELFVDGSDAQFEDLDGEQATTWDDSPIKRDQLASSPKILNPSNEPLGLLAANHAKAALTALNLNLPGIAIHQLKKAAELVPLDVVIGYWLARLQVGTGRRKQCLEGRQTAISCAQVANAMGDDFTFQTMICRVLVARASERLGDSELALEYAEAAHDGMPHHWMAKLEYARMLALAHEKAAAFQKVKEAFWLRPETIRLVENDAAYRSLGKDFGNFRAHLWQTVDKEIEAISEVESRIRGFEMLMGDDPTSLPLAGYSLTDVPPPLDWSLSKWPTITEPVDAFQQYKLSSILQRVRQGRTLAKSGLEILQRSAKKIAKDAIAFEFEGNKGFTPDVREQIKRRREISATNVGELTKEIQQLAQNIGQINEQKTAFLKQAGWVGGIATVIVLLIWLAGYAWVAVLVILVMLAASLWTYSKFTTIEASRSLACSKGDTLKRKATQALDALKNLSQTLHSFEAEELKLRTNIHSFCDLVDQFEAAALKRVTVSPVVPMDRKGNQTIVRVDPIKASELAIEVDAKLLPANLRYLIGDSDAKLSHWIARRVKSGTADVLSRSAAYFQ